VCFSVFFFFFFFFLHVYFDACILKNAKLKAGTRIRERESTDIND